MNTTARIAWRNLGRNRKRTGLALTAIAIAQLAVMVSDGFILGYVDAMLRAMTGPLLGHVQVHEGQWRKERAMDLVVDGVDAKTSAISALPGVQRVSSRIYGPALAATGQDGHMVVVMGVDPNQEAGEGGLLARAPPDGIPSGQRVLVGAGLARREGMKVGQELAIVGQAADGSIANDLFIIAGLLPTAVDLVNRSGVVMEMDAAQELFVMPDQAHEITVHGEDPELAPALADRIGALASLASFEVLDWRRLAPELVTMIEMADVSTFIVVLFVFLAAAAGVANTMLMSTFERRSELGMLLALGVSPGRLVRIITLEAVGLGLIGVTLGTVLGVAAVQSMASTGINLASLGDGAVEDLAFSGLSYSLTIYPRVGTETVIVGMACVTLTSLLASLWPAVYAARLQPVDAMRS